LYIVLGLNTILFLPLLERDSLFEAAGTQDYRKLTMTPWGLKATTRWLMRQGLLQQFQLAAKLLNPQDDIDALQEALDEERKAREKAAKRAVQQGGNEMARLYQERQLQLRIDASW
jgi:hypothetical protein